MKRLYWIARAAWYMRGLFGYWKPRDLAFCWETASVVYDGRTESGFDIGDPDEEMAEEFTYWND